MVVPVAERAVLKPRLRGVLHLGQRLAMGLHLPQRLLSVALPVLRLADDLLLLIAGGLSGCAQTLNPFYEPPTEEALLGEPNDHALSGTQENTGSARAALRRWSC